MKSMTISPAAQKIVSACVGIALCVSLVGISLLWWNGQGPFRQVHPGSPPELVGQEQICFFYDNKDTQLDANLLRFGDWFTIGDGVMINYRKKKLVALQKRYPSLPLTKLFTLTGSEVPANANDLADIDAEIRQSIRHTIEKNGLRPQELAAKQERASFWGPPRIRPYRLFVQVKKRFEKDQCIYWVHVELQKDAVIDNAKQQHTYIGIDESWDNLDKDFDAVPREKAKEAIAQSVAKATDDILRKGLGK